jgi:hypothetical protein
MPMILWWMRYGEREADGRRAGMEAGGSKLQITCDVCVFVGIVRMRCMCVFKSLRCIPCSCFAFFFDQRSP